MPVCVCVCVCVWREGAEALGIRSLCLSLSSLSLPYFLSPRFPIQYPPTELPVQPTQLTRLACVVLACLSQEVPQPSRQAGSSSAPEDGWGSLAMQEGRGPGKVLAGQEGRQAAEVLHWLLVVHCDPCTHHQGKQNR